MSERQYVAAGFAVPAGLDTLHALLQRVGEEHPDVAPGDLMLFETAVIEIAANVVEHVGAGGTTTWTFTVALTGTELRGELSDNGTAFDGDLAPDLPADLWAESGRGLALARSSLDELTYHRDGGANHWHLVRVRRG